MNLVDPCNGAKNVNILYTQTVITHTIAGRCRKRSSINAVSAAVAVNQARSGTKQHAYSGVINELGPGRDFAKVSKIFLSIVKW